MGLNPTKTDNVSAILASDYNEIYKKLVAQTSNASSPSAGEIDFRDDLGFNLYYYDNSTFSGPSATRYRVNIGVEATGTASDSAVRIPKADSGQNFVPKASTTWGIFSNKFYSVTDANGDLVLIETLCSNQTAQLTVSGTLNSGTNFRLPELIFSAIDDANYMAADMFNGNLRLFKVDAGTPSAALATFATTTADGTNYTICAVRNADAITVYLNGTSRISYTQVAGDYKYMGGTKAGIRLAKGGTPGTIARSSGLYVRQAQ